MADEPKTLSPALREALPLLRNRPVSPSADDGYLDLLDGEPVAASSVIQRLWLSRVGSMLYDHAQGVVRSFLARVSPSLAGLVAAGGTALDVGCGPGNITAELGRVVGPTGLALGVDVSPPMLRRAVSSAAPQVGFLRANALDLPLCDGTVDAVTCFAVLQLIPEPFAVLDEIVRVLRPEGRVMVMVPTVRFGPLDRLGAVLGTPGGVRFFGPVEMEEALHERGFGDVRANGFGPVQWVTGQLSTGRS
jgi:arsenite methyltransferase